MVEDTQRQAFGQVTSDLPKSVLLADAAGPSRPRTALLPALKAQETSPLEKRMVVNR